MKNIKIVYVIVIVLTALNSNSQPSGIYNGGINQGYIYSEISDDGVYLVSGGIGKGNDLAEIESGQFALFRGGQEDGTSKAYVQHSSENFLQLGGLNDGYIMQSLRPEFIWTGAMGTGWTVASNWNYNIVPDINRSVIIPDGVPNWPYINTGLLNIGDNPNNGTYKCASLWIQDGALLVTRVNNRIENYGLIIIDGTLQMKKQTADAFKNMEGGVVLINSGGELLIKP